MGRDPNMGRDGVKNGSRGDPVRKVSFCPKTRQNSAFLWNLNSMTIKYFLNIKHKHHAACRTLRYSQGAELSLIFFESESLPVLQKLEC